MKYLRGALPTMTTASSTSSTSTTPAAAAAATSAITTTTIRGFLDEHLSDTKCLHVPGLSFTNYESSSDSLEQIHKDIPKNVNPNLLLTLRHRKHGKRTGTFSKALVNLRHISLANIKMDYIKSVHNPNTFLCGENGQYGSGQDYIASVFRLNHYVGTQEAYLERSGDVRLQHKTADQLEEKNQAIGAELGDDDDIRPWVHSFVQQVGQPAADQLLLQPLERAYDAKPKN
jgi:hypothetical protein